MQERYGDLAGTFFKLHPNSTQEPSGNSQKAAFRDAGLMPMYMWAARREKAAKNKVFMYYWTYAEMGSDSARYGAFHTSKVPYVFNTLNQSSRPWTDQGRKIADMIGA
jgi:para-nitrobenzyl esterase